MLDHPIACLGSVEVGIFRCAPDDPLFRDSGPTEHHLVVFPRIAVWIRHAGSRPFLADPGVATIYNRRQEYSRAVAHPAGDRCEWFALSPELALAITRELDRRAPNADERPFHWEYARTGPNLYLRQRQLVLRLQRGNYDPLWAEEEALWIVAETLQAAEGFTGVNRKGVRHREEHLHLVDRAKAEISQNLAAATDVTSLAGRLGASPFHLCRVFRSITGSTLHNYRLELRLRMALERIGESGVPLSRLAFELGFSSHSHFTATVRRLLGRTPTALRRELGQAPTSARSSIERSA